MANRASCRRAAGLAISALLVLGTFATAANAADRRDDHRGDDHRGGEHRGDDHRGGDHRGGGWNGGYYAAPPVVYGAPYYSPPPVVGIYLGGIGINIR